LGNDKIYGTGLNTWPLFLFLFHQGEVEMNLDEHPKPKTTIEQLAKLPTVFKKVCNVHRVILYIFNKKIMIPMGLLFLVYN
jgi:hypothetical protein